MEQMMITMSDISGCASSMRTQNTSMRLNLDEIHTIMNQLATYWQSPAAETLRARFQAMLPVFDNYKIIIDHYAKFLDQTVETYQTMEQKLNAHAESFQ